MTISEKRTEHGGLAASKKGSVEKGNRQKYARQTLHKNGNRAKREKKNGGPSEAESKGD